MYGSLRGAPLTTSRPPRTSTRSPGRRSAGQPGSEQAFQAFKWGWGCARMCACAVLYTRWTSPPQLPRTPRGAPATATMRLMKTLSSSQVGSRPVAAGVGRKMTTSLVPGGLLGVARGGGGGGGACGIESEGVGGGGGGGGGGAARQPSKQPPHPPSELGPLSSNRHTQPPRPAPPHRTAPYRTPTAPHLAKRYVSFSATSRSPTSKVGNMESEGIKRGSAMARRIA